MKKKVLAALLAVCMLASLMFIPASAAGFDDVADDHWAKEAIERWADFGVLNGVGGGNFSPDRAMNRAEFAKMVVELMGFTAKSGKTFPDVEADSSLDWAKDYIDIAATNGIIGGYPDGSFGGKREVTFEGGATMLGRALGLVTIDETSGDNYATGAANKLDELGMLDDNVKVGMTFDRAGVAGLANNMIGAYVTEGNTSETQDGVITGEVPGVILVKGNVSVEIKDATVAAPIVVLGASVELTGTTTAPAVKVAGEKASVTAGADTKIETVSVEGTDATVKLDGEVTSVTVAEDATVAEITGDGVSADNVTNNSAAEIEVNGEPVAPAGTEPAGPDDGQGDMTGFVPNPPTRPTCQHEWDAGTQTVAPTCTKKGIKTFVCSKCNETKTEELDMVDHTYGTAQSISDTQHKQVCSVCGDVKTADHTNTADTSEACTDCGYVVTIKGETPAGHTHEWETTPTGEGTTPATCAAEGKNVYKCTAELDEGGECTATKEVPVAKLAHTFGEWTEKTPGTCTTYAVMERECSVCHAKETKNGELDATEHTEEAIPAVAPTCSATGLTAGTRCSACKKVLTAQKSVPIDANAHDWNEWDPETGTRTCKLNERHTETCDHSAGYEGGVCKTCGKAEPATDPVHEHSWTRADKTGVCDNKDGLSDGCTQTHTCTEWNKDDQGCTVCGKAHDCQKADWSEGTTCTKCGNTHEHDTDDEGACSVCGFKES